MVPEYCFKIIGIKINSAFVMNSFINVKGCSSNNIKQKFDSVTKKTLIHVDCSRFRYVILAVDKPMKKCMHKIENMPLQTSSFFSVLARWANLLVFPVKSSMYLYSDRKPCAC